MTQNANFHHRLLIPYGLPSYELNQRFRDGLAQLLMKDGLQIRKVNWVACGFLDEKKSAIIVIN